MRTRPEPVPLDAAPVQLPLLASRPFTGFSNPGEDFVEQGLDLNALLIHNYPATFLFQAESPAMNGAGIWQGDYVLVDRSRPVQGEDVVILALEGDFLIRRWTKQEGKVILMAEHPDYPPVEITSETAEARLFGVVTYVLHRPNRPKRRAR